MSSNIIVDMFKNYKPVKVDQLRSLIKDFVAGAEKGITEDGEFAIRGDKLVVLLDEDEKKKDIPYTLVTRLGKNEYTCNIALIESELPDIMNLFVCDEWPRGLQVNLASDLDKEFPWSLGLVTEKTKQDAKELWRGTIWLLNGETPEEHLDLATGLFQEEIDEAEETGRDLSSFNVGRIREEFHIETLYVLRLSERFKLNPKILKDFTDTVSSGIEIYGTASSEDPGMMTER